MSLHDDLAAVKRCLDDLVRTVGHLERRLTAERGGAPGTTALRTEPLVPVPDTPYRSELWTDVDDEGLGARGRHAP
ncbi:hypothetical protein [Streptomyces sp. NBC_01216]|uniref:hypothetical protein n=1 Tax=unclassified Streptomyces TaxID=2593676 RepID=UPI002E1047AD|nr:hypothetical protein OG393_10360 [Streptomyces sp. NBC_01216]